VHLYIVSFGEGVSDENDYEEEDADRGRVHLNDLWWADKIIDDKDLFDMDVDGGGGGAGPSTQNGM
jgi:hypothetical protein